MDSLGKRDLFGLTASQIKPLIEAFGLPGFTARQITDWMYHKRVADFTLMTNLSAATRTLLAEHFIIGLIRPDSVQTSADCTKKYLYCTGNNRFVEAVFIPDGDRATLCVSTQVGCKMGCRFCMTARQGFSGHLSAGAILNQLFSLPEFDLITNVVYMGMGEPLDNLDNVLGSLHILTSAEGLGWSPKRITVSTIGIIPAMRVFVEQSGCHLAVSLHSPFTDERKLIMPIENAYPLEDLIAELKSYDFGRQRRISFEYIMFSGFNDTPRHSRELVRLLGGLKCRINLIRFHRIPDSSLEGSDLRTMESFRDFVSSKGVITTIRASRGEDIFAACGMLSTNRISEVNL